MSRPLNLLWSDCYARLEHVESGNLIARRLLTHILQVDESFLWAHPDFVIEDTQLKALDSLIARAAQHEPLAYLLGYADFYGLRFEVDRRVLIPRPESERLVQLALAHIDQIVEADATIIDVGTGSGCIALSIAFHAPGARIYAVDVSSEALELAQHNASLLGIQNVAFLQGNLLEPLVDRVGPQSIDVVVANLPYISDAEYLALDRNVRDYEPALALKSGAEANTLNHQLAQQVPIWLNPGGIWAYETTNGQIVDGQSYNNH